MKPEVAVSITFRAGWEASNSLESSGETALRLTGHPAFVPGVWTLDR